MIRIFHNAKPPGSNLVLFYSIESMILNINHLVCHCINGSNDRAAELFGEALTGAVGRHVHLLLTTNPSGLLFRGKELRGSPFWGKELRVARPRACL